jgi:hypothetical protein
LNRLFKNNLIFICAVCLCENRMIRFEGHELYRHII